MCQEEHQGEQNADDPGARVNFLDLAGEQLDEDVDFTKKKYAQFLPETLAAASNAAADILSGGR